MASRWGLSAICRSLGAVGLGLVFGSAFGAHAWLDTPSDLAASTGFALRQNRAAALGFGLTLAVAFGFFAGVEFTVGAAQSVTSVGPLRLLVSAFVVLVANGWLGYVIYGRVGGAVLGVTTVGGYILAGATSSSLVGLIVPPVHGLSSLHNGIVGVWFGVAYGLAVGVTGVISRAWGSFCLVRIWLALHGRVPWRLMWFLDDAQRRGVLRQSGAVYQFRHAKLQDQLAKTTST